MASQEIVQYRENAEIFHGNDICQEKILEFQKEYELPVGILRLKDITEFGFNRQVGLMWACQKEKTEHQFKKLGTRVSYDPEITCFVERRKISKLKGIKTREFMIWLPLTDMCIDEKNPEKINCKTSTGLGKTLPVAGFRD